MIIKALAIYFLLMPECSGISDAVISVEFCIDTVCISRVGDIWTVR